MRSGENKFSVGVLIPNKSSTYFDTGWSKVPDQISLHFVDEKDRRPYVIPLSLTNVNQQVRSGKCREVTIRILDYDKAEAICK